MAKGNKSQGAPVKYAEEDRLYTTSEVTRILRVEYMTAWRYINKGELPATRVGNGRLRVHGAHLNEYLRKREMAKRKTASGRNGKKKVCA